MTPESGLDALNAAELSTLRAGFDTAIPADDWPGGWDGGVRTLLAEHGDGFLRWAIAPLRRAAKALDDGARGLGVSDFSALALALRAQVFAELLDGEPPPHGPLRALLRVAFEGFYGGTSEPAGWAMVGFRPVPDGVTPVEPAMPEPIAPAQLARDYDVIVVGGGAGGGVAAAELTRHGLRVLVIERSRPMTNRELRGDHLRGKRAELYDPTAGPGPGHPRVHELADGTTKLLDGAGNGTDWGLTAMTLGGGTRLWQGMSWRFMAEDFAMATTYGVPEDSTLADWPFGYEELAPYYDRVEWELGVSGSGSSPISLRTPRMRDYPMPPLDDDVTRTAFTAAAERLGWQASPIPFAINTVPRDGRPACVRCHQCVGHACPVDAKNGSHNTFIPRALATGRCDLIMSAQVLEVQHDGRGQARGVRLVTETDGEPVERTVAARRVVLAAGAIETPRLLLASGLGNHWVGRNSHNHGLALALATIAPPVKTRAGPGHSVATFDFVHRDPDAWGGGVVFDCPPQLPVLQAQMGEMTGAPFGRKHKQWMRDSPVPVGAMSMVQEIPHHWSRVTADPRVQDRYGMPVARMRGRAHPASVVAAQYMVERCAEWVEEVGGTRLVRIAIGGGAHATEHCAGTARLGHDPTLSACDARGRLHGTSNVYVADASLHPTNGSVNPGLTVMANAMRVAALIGDER